MRFCPLLALLGSAVGIRATQLSFTPLHEALAAPEQSLSSVSADEFTHFSHHAFPGYGARVKRTKDFCDETVKAYTGYIDNGPKHLFFWFFESRNDPKHDDVQLWINGGPGGSAAVGLFMELGPCRVNDFGNATYPNPYSWTEHANMFFLDQPIGTGFSYADFGEVTDTTEDAAKVVAAFLYMFFETFSEFKGRPFHMSGESYAGRFIPVFASEIVDQNKKAASLGYTPINMASVMIGNGFTDVKEMMMSYYDMTCTNASVPPVLDISVCVRMKRSLPRCERMLQEECRTNFDELGCRAAALFCVDEIVMPFDRSGWNPHDLSDDCGGKGSGTGFCYDIIYKTEDYLNREDVRKVMGIESDFGHYEIHSSNLGARYEWHENQLYIASLLERGVDVLIYVGAYDWVCNWVGNSRWVEKMDWRGQKEYNSKEFEEWMVDGHAAGLTKSSKGLTFATIYAAGHMVPYDKPAESLAMVKRWISSRNLMQ